MAAKGTEAKEKLIENFIKANSDNYIGCFDKKYYFWSNENGEKVQIAVSLTCPKTPIEIDSNVVQTTNKNEMFNWDSSTAEIPVASSTAAATITEEEQENLRVLMEKLGL